jgi:hypothetical protein
MINGGWKNSLSERWVNRITADKASGISEIVNARLFSTGVVTPIITPLFPALVQDRQPQNIVRENLQWKPGAVWNFAVNNEAVSNQFNVPGANSSIDLSPFGKGIKVSGTSNLDRYSVYAKKSAFDVGANDFSVFVIFRFDSGNPAGATSLFGRWGTDTANSDWDLGGWWTGNTAQFQIIVGSTVYTASVSKTWVVGDTYALFGRRSKTTIFIDCYDYVNRTWTAASLTDAGVTTVNWHDANTPILLGAERDGTQLNSNCTYYLAGTFPRKLSNSQLISLAQKSWQVLSTSRNPIVIDKNIPVVLAGQAQAAAVGSGVIASTIALTGASVSAATGTGAITSAMSLAGSSAALTAATGAVTMQLSLSGSSIAAAVAAGGMAMTQPLAGSAQAQAAASGDLIFPVNLAGTALAASGAVGQITMTLQMSGSSIAQVLAAAGINSTQSLAGVAIAQALASASLGSSQALAGSAIVYALANAGLDINQSLSGSSIAQVLASANLLAMQTLSGSAMAQVIANAAINSTQPLSGEAIAQAVANAGLNINQAISGTAAASVVANGMLDVLSNGGLEGVAIAQAIAQGNIGNSMPLAASASAFASGAGNLSLIMPISGAAVAVSIATGNLTATVSFNGAAVAQALAIGDIKINFQLDGAAIAETLAVAEFSQIITSLSGAVAAGTIAMADLIQGALAISGTASAQASAQADLYTQTLTGFSQLFYDLDKIILSALGSKITLTAPSGFAINTKCVLSARPSMVNQESFAWRDNLAAKIDQYSLIIDVLESEAIGISKKWMAMYQTKTYAISEILPKGDGTLMLILNQAGNSIAVASGWR